MSPIYLYDGKILVRDGKIATSQDCCCGPPPPGDCDCILIWLNLCHCITVEIQAYDGNGVLTTYTLNGLLPAAPAGPFNGMPVNFVLIPAIGGGGGTSFDIAATLSCDVNNKQANIGLEIVATANGLIYCDQAATIQVNTIQLVNNNLQNLDCNLQGFTDIAGNYNMQLGLTNPNPCIVGGGGAAASAQWVITQKLGGICAAC